MAGPLSGVKVLDFTHVYSGPFCTLLLRDLGAEVIKIEKVEGGDTVRNDAPHTKGMESGIFINLNRGKKGITLDLESERGKEIAKSLVKKVDIVVENFSFGTMEKLGLGYEELSKLNPQLIYASISGYGRSGPRRDHPGYDPVIQASAGMTSITGFKDQPVKCGAAIADFGAGVFTALAITSAYIHCLKTGEGQQIDISLQDCTWLLASLEFSPLYFLKGTVPERTGNGHPVMTPGSLYKAKDGAVIIATGNLGQVKRLFTLIGGSELVNSPMCSPQHIRIKFKEQIDAVVEKWTQQYSQDEIVQQLKEINIACAKVPSYDQVCNDPQLVHRKMIIDIEQLVSGKVTVPGSPFKMSKTSGDISFPAPFHGEHNSEIFSELLGLSETEIATLSCNRVI